MRRSFILIWLALFSIVCAGPSLAQTVKTVSVNFDLGNYQNAGLNTSSLSVSPLDGNQVINGITVAPKSFYFSRAQYPTLTNGVLSNVVLYAGFRYAATNGDGICFFWFLTPTNLANGASINAGDYTVVRTNQPAGMVARSASSSDALYSPKLDSGTNILIDAGTNGHLRINSTASGSGTAISVTSSNQTVGIYSNSIGGEFDLSVPTQFSSGAITNAPWLTAVTSNNISSVNPSQIYPPISVSGITSNQIVSLNGSQVQGAVASATTAGTATNAPNGGDLNVVKIAVTNTQANVTLSTNFSVITPGNYRVTGCSFYPFLNGLWNYVPDSGWYINGTNYLYYDQADSTWIFAWSTDQSLSVYGNVFEANFFSDITAGQWSQPPLGDYDYDATTLTPTVQTNLIINSAGLTSHYLVPGDNTFEIWYDEYGWPILKFRKESGSGGDVGFYESYGNSLIPLSTGIGAQGAQSFRLNGGVTTLIPGEDRAQVIVGFYFGLLAQGGGTMSFLTRHPVGYATLNNSTIFNSGLTEDVYGRLTGGDSPWSHHGLNYPASAELELWPSTILDVPTFRLRPGGLTTNLFAGSFEVAADAGNTLYYTHTNAGVLVREPVFAGNNASGMTFTNTTPATAGQVATFTAAGTIAPSNAVVYTDANARAATSNQVNTVTVTSNLTLTATANAGTGTTNYSIGGITTAQLNTMLGIATIPLPSGVVTNNNAGSLSFKSGVNIGPGNNVQLSSSGGVTCSTISDSGYAGIAGYAINSAGTGLGVYTPTSSGYVNWSCSNLVGVGTITAMSGFASYASNTLALTSISFPATTVKWTNTFAQNIFVFIDNSGVTGTSLAINGTQISSTLLVTGDTLVPLHPGEYFSETYTIGTPAAVWKPNP